MSLSKSEKIVEMLLESRWEVWFLREWHSVADHHPIEVFTGFSTVRSAYDYCVSQQLAGAMIKSTETDKKYLVSFDFDLRDGRTLAPVNPDDVDDPGEDWKHS